MAAGLLAIFSAGTITTVLANVLGRNGFEALAAITAAVSGALSLLVASYFGDDDILAMLTGSSRYLALRELVYKVLLDRSLTIDEQVAEYASLQSEYAKLDEQYSRYFTLQPFGKRGSSRRSPRNGAEAEIERLTQRGLTRLHHSDADSRPSSEESAAKDVNDDQT